ncbi:MAG: sugar ABC transporter permease, partial [Planctomycetes bacterium]|nr:sugar ABC transporter permease [Planctomycetota bacterium]
MATVHSEDVAEAPQVTGRDIREYLASHLREYGLLFALIAIMAFFQLVTDGTLLRAVNVTNLLLQNSYIIIMALGMLVVIVSGNIDLSVGSVMGFIGALAAVMIVNYDQSVLVTVVACLFTGAVIGAAQGYWIAYWKIPSFIVTLAGMLVFRGLSLWLLEGQSVGPFPKGFQVLSTGFIPDYFGIGRPNGTAIAAGLVAVALIIWVGLRDRAHNRKYGIEGEP